MIKSTFLVMFCLLAMFGNCKQTFGQALAPMIPKPVEVKNFAGTFQLTAKSKVVTPAGNAEIEEIAQSFAGQLASVIGQKPEIVSRNQKQSIEFKINAEFNSRLGNEGYFLSVTPKMITISANKPVGLFYGAQTLLQMISPDKTNAPIQLACTEITDYPRFGWRGLMLDVSRHFFTKEEVKRFIDQMAKYKFNVFHWHLTDNQGWRIEIKGLPQLTNVGAWRVARTGNFGYFAPPADGEQSTDGGFYTQDEVRDIVKYAQERYVTIVPEIDVPGHSLAFIASYPESSCTQAQYPVNAGFPTGADVVLCAGNDDVFKKLETIFSEVASLFPGKYIHIGGDEADKAFWKKCPKCQERIKQENLKNEEELQSYFIKKVSKMLESNGKKLIGWDEILEGGLASNAAVMSWRGTEGGAAAAKAGHPVVMTPNQYCYLDHTQGENVIERYGILFCCFMRMKEAYKFDPMTGVTDSAYVLGGQGNLWTEMVPNYRRAEYMVWPRALALSEVLWSPKANRDWDEFVPRVEAQFQRFDKADVNYAPSMYDPDISMIKAGEDDYRIVFTPEIKGLDVYYTFDFTFPDHHSAKYDGQPIKTPKGATDIWAITYRNGKPIGRLLTIKFDELKTRMGK